MHFLDSKKRVYQEQRCKKNDINGIDSPGPKQMRYLFNKHMILCVFYQALDCRRPESREILTVHICDNWQRKTRRVRGGF
jgi:hypothetical protein